MRFILPILLFWSFVGLAQSKEFSSGILWSTNLSWEQVKQKAKKENKYIFLDCYATWCGPCKSMDKYVFTNVTIGEYFNQKFVAVKVQMDETVNDNDLIKSWYATARQIEKRYFVDAYPTYIFLSPDGVLTSKVTGFRNVDNFLNEATIACAPGKVYDDQFLKYDSLRVQYKNGHKDYDSYPFLIRMAFKAKENDFGHHLLKELSTYVSTLKRRERYTRERIELWSSFIVSSNTRIFHFFYKDGKTIDKVMNKSGFSETVIDATIQTENVTPFLVEQAKGSAIAMTGMYVTDISGKNLLKTDFSEADWNKLFVVIKKRFNAVFAKRNVLKGKLEWYKRHRNDEKFFQTGLSLYKIFSPDYDSWEEVYKLNELSWEVFKKSTDRKTIDGAIICMKKLCMAFEKRKRAYNTHLMYDTYANLLYKAGNIEEAILYENKAVNASFNDLESKEGYIKTIEQMKKGEPTYSATWGYN